MGGPRLGNRAPRVGGRSSEQACLESQRGGESLRRSRSSGSSTTNEPNPHASGGNRACASGAGVGYASLNDHRLPFRTCGDTAQPVLAAILENQCDGFQEAAPRFVLGPPLSVGAGDLRAVRDVPPAVTLEHRRELVSHLHIYDCPASPGSQASIRGPGDADHLQARRRVTFSAFSAGFHHGLQGVTDQPPAFGASKTAVTSAANPSSSRDAAA